MAERVSRERWRNRVEHFLESDVGVHDWCTVNHISSSAMFRHLNAFAVEEPEIFGGPQNIADRSQARWVTRTRENMRAAKALSVPTRTAGPSGFVRVGACPPIPAEPEPAWAPPRAEAQPQPITVALNSAVVSIPAGCGLTDVAAVLEAVASL